ncbi:MAG TPA: hypothetical protein PLT66_05380 [Bacillota bacterium]|nr:hypothetical protein [Bacillota bacterium]
MKKIVLILLSLLLVFSFVACDNSNDNSTPASSVGGTSADTSAENEHYSAKIPAGFELSNKDVIIVTSASVPKDQTTFDFCYNREEMETNVINTAALERVNYVEELLDCTITERCLDRWANEAASVLPNEINGGTANYYIVSSAVQEASTLVYQGIYYDLNSLDGLNGLAEPWWDAAFTEAATIDDKIFFATGDISFRSRETLACMLFNKEMVSQLDLSNPYQLVKDKQWTMDTVLTWSKLISKDMNDDGKINYKDKFGIGGQNDNIWSMFYGGGESTVSRQSDGTFKVNLSSEHAVNVAESIMALMQNKEYFVCANDYWNESGYVTSPSEFILTAFLENRCLLLSTSLSNISKVREMAVDFGILPMPLYDENQDEYCSFMNPWAGAVFSIPISLYEDEAEEAAVLLEILGAEGKNTLIPAYYEVCLQGQSTRDDESIEMLDLILETAGCDSGHIYDWGKVGYNVLHGAITASAGTFVSLVQSNQNAIEAGINRTIEAFEELG